MNNRISRAAGVLLAILTAAALAGCHKGDGTEVIPDRHSSVAVKDDEKAAEKDKLFEGITEDPNAKQDAPFPLDSPERPKQEILLVMIYDNTEEELSHTQTVNYWDRDGRNFRYRHPVDPGGDWLDLLYDHYDNGAVPVNIMSETEKQTLWQIAAHSGEYAAAAQAVQDPGKDIYGVTWIYAINERDEPILLARYDDTCVYPDNSEVTAFLNWFRYFYHGSFVFGG